MSQNQTNMLYLFLLCLRENRQGRQREICLACREVQSLKNGKSIGETERHYLVFKMSWWTPENESIWGLWVVSQGEPRITVDADEGIRTNQIRSMSEGSAVCGASECAAIQVLHCASFGELDQGKNCSRCHVPVDKRVIGTWIHHQGDWEGGISTGKSSPHNDGEQAKEMPAFAGKPSLLATTDLRRQNEVNPRNFFQTNSFGNLAYFELFWTAISVWIWFIWICFQILHCSFILCTFAAWLSTDPWLLIKPRST